MTTWRGKLGIVSQLIIISTFVFNISVAHATGLAGEQTTVDDCLGSPCYVDVNGGFGEYFNVYPLSLDVTDRVALVEVYIVDNNSLGYQIEVCDEFKCERSPTQDSGVRIQNAWRGYDFSGLDLQLKSTISLKLYSDVDGVYVGAASNDYYSYGEMTDARSAYRDIAFRIYGVTPSLATIKVIKQVTNDSGGSQTASGFGVTLRYSSDASDISPTSVAEPETTFSVATGDYVVYQSDASGNYVMSIGGACAADGSVHVNPGETKTCYANFNDNELSGWSMGSSVNNSESVSSESASAFPFPTLFFSGRAYPGASLTLVKKVLNEDEVLKQGIFLGEYGNFSFGGIVADALNYSLIVKDKYGRLGAVKTYTRKSGTHSLTVKNILFSPTVDFVRSTVTRGDVLRVVGSAFPDMYVQVKMDNGIIYETMSDISGTYRVNIKTVQLETGSHSVTVRSIDKNTKQKSDFSITKTFVISNLKVLAADLNGDDKINITDWSIFLEKWRQVKNNNIDLVPAIDFNKDEKVDISDFAIFLRAFAKK